jgi:hypothetical protein
MRLFGVSKGILMETTSILAEIPNVSAMVMLVAFRDLWRRLNLQVTPLGERDKKVVLETMAIILSNTMTAPKDPIERQILARLRVDRWGYTNVFENMNPWGLIKLEAVFNSLALAGLVKKNTHGSWIAVEETP